MTKLIQRNCPSPERSKAILGVLGRRAMLGIAKRQTFRKMAKS
jgi:hypothetical protein